MALEKATAEISNKQPLTLQEVVSIKQTLGLNNANLQGSFTLTLANDVSVPTGGTFDITPDTVVTNTFGDVLQLDEANRLFKTFNNEQLNLGVDVFLALEGGTLSAFDVALQRGNEANLIERTKRQLFQRPTQGQNIGGPTGVTLSTFTSGVNDPFNNEGFKFTFFNPTSNDVTILAGEVRIDIFAIYDLDELISDVLDSTTTLLTNSTEITFERNSIHGTKDIPLSSASFDLTDSVVGNVVQVWFQGNSLPTATDLYWTNDTDEDFVALERCLLTLNLHPDGVIVGTLINI